MSLEQFSTILLGWLFGLLTPGIAERIRRPYRRLDFQRAVLHIRYHLDLYNQLAAYTQSQFDKTFNNPSPQDRAALVTNQEEGYRDVCQRAEAIMRAIGELES